MPLDLSSLEVGSISGLRALGVAVLLEFGFYLSAAFREVRRDFLGDRSDAIQAASSVHLQLVTEPAGTELMRQRGTVDSTRCHLVLVEILVP